VIAKPDGHPYLRLTRVLQPSMVVTIEPGIYFIDMLLERLKAGPPRLAASTGRAWRRSDRSAGSASRTTSSARTAEPMNLTRDGFAEVA
jgi:Xaa-Pro dipeptidase